MNSFKNISYRYTLYRLQKMQLSSSTSDSKFIIPPRIKRGPTDILNALHSTVPRDALRSHYKFHDDPFLLPSKKSEYSLFAMSYESGKKTAMLIHKEHSDLFPQDLSEPPIEAFKPPVKYTPESKVSEEILLEAILKYKVQDAIAIYELLENVSNKTRQALLELLCYNNGQKYDLTNLLHQRWYIQTKQWKMWMYHPVIYELYEYLVAQDSATAAAAHNAMICGFIKWRKEEEAWRTYNKCKTEDIPLNVTAYNSLIQIIGKICRNNKEKTIMLLYDMLTEMSSKGIRPNTRTLNAALKLVTSSMSRTVAEKLGMCLLPAFERLNVKYSLGSYYYMLLMFDHTDTSNKVHLTDIIKAVEKKNFTVEDEADFEFFPYAMSITSKFYNDKLIADRIHKILFSNNNNNRQFIESSLHEKIYYFEYMKLLLSTCKIDEFFGYYTYFVPYEFIPNASFMRKILVALNLNPPEIRVKYLPRLWSDSVTHSISLSRICFPFVTMMDDINLPVDASIKALFADVAWSTWNFIQNRNRIQEMGGTIDSNLTIAILSLLLRDGRVKHAKKVSETIFKDPDMFLQHISYKNGNKLFNIYISVNCIKEALDLLEYFKYIGLKYMDMATKLYNTPNLENVYREELINLVGEKEFEKESIPSSN